MVFNMKEEEIVIKQEVKVGIKERLVIEVSENNKVIKRKVVKNGLRD